MTDGYVDGEILRRVSESLLEDYRQEGRTFSPEDEGEFMDYVAGLVDADPPDNEQVWETVEVLMKTIEAKDRDLALRSISVFLVQFISGVDHTVDAFECIPMLIRVKDEIKAEHFREARELLMAFLNKARAVARSM